MKGEFQALLFKLEQLLLLTALCIVPLHKIGSEADYYESKGLAVQMTNLCIGSCRG